MRQRMFQSCFLICILLALGAGAIVSCSKPREVEISPISDLLKLDRILHVGDVLPCFSLNDVRDSDYGIEWNYGNTIIPGRTIPPHIFFKARIDLRDGSRYICTNPDGCIVKVEGCIITQGTIKVYKKGANQDFRKN